MFSKLALFTVASMAIFAAAAPSGGMENSCNTGPVQCCNSVQSASSPGMSDLIGLLGATLSGFTGQVGSTAAPLVLPPSAEDRPAPASPSAATATTSTASWFLGAPQSTSAFKSFATATLTGVMDSLNGIGIILQHLSNTSISII
ncbi:hypothetical protein BJ912DRAFT_883951 [Pholiota molesta]|nr:hypothetical protein BJ912DRAFT_883951 [Pholiota molesta]